MYRSEKMEEKWSPLVKTRKSIEELWQAVNFRGRCWGLKKDGLNPMRKTNITLGTQREVVVLRQNDERKNGTLKIYEYRRASGTQLGSAVRKKLEEDGLFKNEREV